MNGWTLLYKTVERDVETKSDVLMAVVHWQLLRAGMKCIGRGNDQTLSQSDEESELLPDGWNLNKTSYALRYKYKNEIFILLGMVVDDLIVLNLLNAKSLKITNAAFLLERTVTELKGQLSTSIPEITQVIDRLQKELFEPVLTANEKTSETQSAHTVKPLTETGDDQGHIQPVELREVDIEEWSYVYDAIKDEIKKKSQTSANDSLSNGRDEANESKQKSLVGKSKGPESDESQRKSVVIENEVKVRPANINIDKHDLHRALTSVSEWHCKFCTFINTGPTVVCSMCFKSNNVKDKPSLISSV